MDIEDQQHDADFVLGQKAKQQQLAVGAMRAHLERMGIDDKALEASRAQAQKALGAGLAQAQVTGDWSGFVDGFNATVGRMPNAQPLAGIQRNSDGSLTMVMANGGKRQFADSRSRTSISRASSTASSGTTATAKRSQRRSRKRRRCSSACRPRKVNRKAIAGCGRTR
jgi:hypothetical protein